MRSDTECEGSSETETQKENMVQKVQKKTAGVPGPSSVNEDPNSDKNELARKVQNASLACTGTVMRGSKSQLKQMQQQFSQMFLSFLFV